MGAISRYFDSLIAPLFKKDDLGRTLFFPAGIWSKGRVINDAATLESLKTRVRRAYMVLFGLLIPAVAVGNAMISRSNWPVVIAVAIAIGLGLQAYFWSLGRNLPVTDTRMTMKEAYASQATALGKGWLKALAIGSAIFVVGSAAMAVFATGADRWIGVGGIVMFGACLAIFLRQIRGLKSSGA